MKKVLLKLCEYAIVLCILLFFCFYINKGIKILGLYMDDLYYWSYFPGTDLPTFAFKFYEGASRYRAFYDMLQYIEYYFVKNNPLFFTYVNLILNSLVALFIYYFSKKLKAGVAISIILSILYLLSHFSYYQIGQVIGLVETISLFLALLILYYLIQYIRCNKIYQYILLHLLFFLIAFTHERYLFLFGIIFISIIFSEIVSLNKKKVRNIFIKICLLIVNLGIILYIKTLATGKILPAGTGGTFVEDTFNINQMIEFIFIQFKYILGINCGQDYLCGINFVDIDDILKKITYIHIIIIGFVFILYFITKFINTIKLRKNELEKRNIFVFLIDKINIDILFILFIILCVATSSVTIRVEMRFVYASFIVFFLYIAYMLSYIFNLLNESNKLKEEIFNIAVLIFISIFILRLPIELKYREYYKNIYFFIDQDRMNSLALNTVYKYGNDIIDKKQVYIIGNTYGMTKFYGDYFFQIYQKDFKLRPIIFINDISELPEDVNNENSIILVEDYDIRGYKEYFPSKLESPITN